MSGTGVTIDVTSGKVRAGLQGLIAQGQDLKPLMEAIGGAMLTSTQQRFLEQKGPDGAAWPAFAPSTLKRMAKSRTAPQLLRDTLRLYNSLVSIAEDDSVELGTNVIYGAIDQFGGDIARPERQASATFRIADQGAATTKDGKRVGSRLRFAKANTRAKSKHTRDFTVPAHSIHIPARPYLGINEADEVEILATIGDAVKAAVPGMEGSAP